MAEQGQAQTATTPLRETAEQQPTTSFETANPPNSKPSPSRPGSAIPNSIPSTSIKDFRPTKFRGRGTSKEKITTLKPKQDGSHATIDPLSQHILSRTNTQTVIPQTLMADQSTEPNSGPSEDLSGRTLVNSPTGEPSPLTRTDSFSKPGSASKDKRKGVSFFSRIIGNKKKDVAADDHDNESIISENRPTGMDAELFSQPIGFIPRFPTPPRYIKVRAQNTRSKDFDRVFLSQLLNNENTAAQKKSDELKPPVATNTTPVTAAGNTSAIWATEFSKDGKYLATAGQDRKVRVWAVISTEDERRAHERQEEAATADRGPTKLSAPVFKTELIREYAEHESSVLDVSWSKNNFLLSSSMDKTVRLWHVSRNECLCVFKHSDFVTSIQFHPRDDRFFLAGSLDSRLRLWSIPDKSVAYFAQVPNMVTAVAFTPDGKYAIAGCYDGLCLIYETTDLKLHAQIHVRSARGKNAKGSKITGIEAITLPKDDHHGQVKLLITSNDSRIRVYNFKDRQLEVKLRGNENTCSQIHATFSDNGRYVICGSEDRKVYIWPMETLERDQEKRPVHVFEAHSAIVTTAIFAPTKTRQLLAQSGDPIYDLVNPPPVTLVDPTDSLDSSKPPSQSGKSVQGRSDSTDKKHEPSKRSEGLHLHGNIIVAADYNGSIKVFRQDEAFEKRQQLSWDTQSNFSKKILGRSASVTTRTSISSSNRRNSISRSSHRTSKYNPSNDRIINWRNSITANHTASRETLGSRRSESGRRRSKSPQKLINERLRQHPSSSRVNGGDAPSVNSDSASTSPRKSPAGDDNNPTEYNPIPLDPENPLRLVGNLSMRYWDTENMERMAHLQPRTPGLLSPEDNSLNRKASATSQFSTDGSSVNAWLSDESPGEEEQCKVCGSKDFKVAIVRASKKDNKETVKRLACSKCGAVV